MSFKTFGFIRLPQPCRQIVCSFKVQISHGGSSALQKISPPYSSSPASHLLLSLMTSEVKGKPWRILGMWPLFFSAGSQENVVTAVVLYCRAASCAWKQQLVECWMCSLHLRDFQPPCWPTLLYNGPYVQLDARKPRLTLPASLALHCSSLSRIFALVPLLPFWRTVILWNTL